MKILLVTTTLVCLAAGPSTASTVFSQYSAPNNGTNIDLTTPATDVNGTFVTGWVYGDQVAAPGHAGEAIWANQVTVNNTSSAAITFGLLIGMWSAGSGQPGVLQQYAGTVPIVINPGIHDVNIYTNWALPASDFWMGFAFTSFNSPTTTAADLNALRFMLSDGPTVGSNNSFALLSSNAVGWTDNPAIGGRQTGFLAQQTLFYDPTDVPEPASVFLSCGGFAVLIGLARFRRRRS